jgi:hypothetical protein
MSDDQQDGISFVAYNGFVVAMMGTIIVGTVRADPCGWSACVGPCTPVFRGAADVDQAKAALRRHLRDWYEALHAELQPGQGERVVRQVLAH